MSLRYCPTDRKHRVDPNDHYCVTCGTKVVNFTCKNKHERFNKADKFCWSCGVALEPIEEEIQYPLPQSEVTHGA